MQEEARFLSAPECLISILLFESMDEKETIQIIGAGQYSKVFGLGHNFSFKEPFTESDVPTYNDVDLFVITAMDASVAHTCKTKYGQYDKEVIQRDLIKATCGFSCSLEQVEDVQLLKGKVITNEEVKKYISIY